MTFVALLLATAVVYARSTRPGIISSYTGCSPKVLRALARVYMARGEYAKAEPLVQKALNDIRGNDSADEQRCSCLIDLAWIYKNQGRLGEAERLCRDGLQMQRQLYYSDHPYIAYTLRILASIYQAQGSYTQAGIALDDAIAIMSKCHSADDPVIASFEVDVARLLVAEGKFTEAEATYEQALRSISEFYGYEHLYTAGVLADIAKLYYLQGKLEQAEVLLSFATSVQQKVYGEENHLLAGNWLAMARICRAKGDLPQAEQLLAKTLGVIENDGHRHPLKGEVLAAMAELYLEQGRYGQAQAVCLEAIGLYKESGEFADDSLATARNCLAKLYVIQGEYAQGYELACSVLKTIESVLGPEHPAVAAVNETLSMAQQLEVSTRLAAIEKSIGSRFASN